MIQNAHKNLFAQVRELRAAARLQPTSHIRPPGPLSVLAANFTAQNPSVAAAAVRTRQAENFSGSSKGGGVGNSSGNGGWAQGLTQQLAGWVQLGPSAASLHATAAGDGEGGGGGRRAMLSGNHESDNEVVVVVGGKEEGLGPSLGRSGRAESHASTIQVCQRFPQ